MPTKSIIAYITEDKPNLKSGYAIINTEVKRGKQMTEEQLLFKQETLSIIKCKKKKKNVVIYI